MFSFYLDHQITQMQLEDRLRDAEQQRLVRRIKAAQRKQTPKGKHLAGWLGSILGSLGIHLS
jgi:hypothetical protein